MCNSFLGGVSAVSGGTEETVLWKSKDYTDCMTCTLYASASGTSDYWTRVIETKGVRHSFGSLVDVEEGKP